MACVGGCLCMPLRFPHSPYDELVSAWVGELGLVHDQAVLQLAAKDLASSWAQSSPPESLLAEFFPGGSSLTIGLFPNPKL